MDLNDFWNEAPGNWNNPNLGNHNWKIDQTMVQFSSVLWTELENTTPPPSSDYESRCHVAESNMATRQWMMTLVIIIGPTQPTSHQQTYNSQQQHGMMAQQQHRMTTQQQHGTMTQWTQEGTTTTTLVPPPTSSHQGMNGGDGDVATTGSGCGQQTQGPQGQWNNKGDDAQCCHHPRWSLSASSSKPPQSHPHSLIWQPTQVPCRCQWCGNEMANNWHHLSSLDWHNMIMDIHNDSTTTIQDKNDDPMTHALVPYLDI